MTGGSQRNGADSLFLQCHALRLAALQLHFLCRRQLEACPVVRQTVANRPPDHGSSQTCRSTIGGTSFLPPPPSIFMLLTSHVGISDCSPSPKSNNLLATDTTPPLPSTVPARSSSHDLHRHLRLISIPQNISEQSATAGNVLYSPKPPKDWRRSR